MEVEELLERRNEHESEREHVSDQSRAFTRENFERLSPGHINKMEGKVTQSNTTHKIQKMTAKRTNR